MATVFHVNDRISIIDCVDLGMKGRTSSYVLKEDKLTIVETSASPSIPHLLNGLTQLGFSPSDVSYVIVTHIHLDHAGGAGLFLEKCPQAKIVVHPKGARHLIDPSRLITGAKTVYQEKFEKLFTPIIPINEEKIIVKEDRDTLNLSENCTLTFYNSPGHANHHFSIHDSVSNGIFTGDAIGIFYQELLDHGLEFYLPSTSPNQFDPEAMLMSAEMIEKLNPDYLYFSHFGISHDPGKAITNLRTWLPLFVDTAERICTKEGGKDTERLASHVTTELENTIFGYLKRQNVARSHSVYDILKIDLSVCAMGLVDYFTKKAKEKIS
ncbi:MBL fold metallo-hydrolase [Metabacillus arenae]|uniref:MBL fold metallo-hydrolase n=1 Tax=Metabacillus arenae TaxID=2771434 RepID=A0A926NGS9_9BACI|nr:MBL fold metallo-hydrolase [Metabacillus arenae]MBD1381279.1 MBL fold metallo-hydrolase [Metabacillus arenae]